MTGTVAYEPFDPASHPGFTHEAYRSTVLRGPRQALVPLTQSAGETTGPTPASLGITADDNDLTTNAARDGEPIGERIIVTGRVLDASGAPVAGTLIELWQANAAGRYAHPVDIHPAPLDPNFVGAGHCITDAEGVYRFLTIKPGAYPWRNHANAWRPAHLHVSVLGPAIATRLVTQMYFPGDPLLELDPILGGVPDGARERLVAAYAHDVTEAEWALGYRWDIVLRGPLRTPEV